MNRTVLLETAIKITNKDREEAYGTPHENFETIAELWNTYIGEDMLGADDIPIMMILLKIARIRSGQVRADNYIDIAGYSALAGEVAEEMEV